MHVSPGGAHSPVCGSWRLLSVNLDSSLPCPTHLQHKHLIPSPSSGLRPYPPSSAEFICFPLSFPQLCPAPASYVTARPDGFCPKSSLGRTVKHGRGPSESFTSAHCLSAPPPHLLSCQPLSQSKDNCVPTPSHSSSSLSVSELRALTSHFFLWFPPCPSSAPQHFLLAGHFPSSREVRRQLGNNTGTQQNIVLFCFLQHSQPSGYVEPFAYTMERKLRLS